MRVCELYDHVAQLGFEEDMQEYDKHFLLTANRALFQVAQLRPETSCIEILHDPMPNMWKDCTFEPQKCIGETIFYADNVKAYYFEARGNITVNVERYDNDSGVYVPCRTPITISNKDYTQYRGFFAYDNDTVFPSGEVRLRFVSDYLYYVRNIALYEHLLSGNTEDIPAYEAFTRYDISELADDFLQLCKPPIVDDGRHLYLMNSEYDVENNRIVLLPHDRPGTYSIHYYKKPNPIVLGTVSLSESQDVVDLDEDLCSILPMLIASYVWADDEPDKAEYYLTLYNTQAALIMSKARDNSPVPYRDTHGW